MTASIDAFRDLAEELGSLDEVLRTADRVFSYSGHQEFWTWIAREAPEGQIHIGGAEQELREALAALLLMRADEMLRTNSNATIEIQPRSWLQTEGSALKDALRQLAEDGNLMDELTIASPAHATEVLEVAIDRSIEDWIELEKEEERRSTVPTSVHNEFLDGLANEWRRTRFLTALLEALEVPIEAGKTDQAQQVLIWMEKRFLVEDRSDARRFAQDMARAISRGEIASLLSGLEEVTTLAATPETLRERIEDAAASLRADGYEPTLVLMSSQWRLHQKAGLDWRVEGHPTPPPALNLPEKSVAPHLGAIADVPVFFATEVDESSLYLMDLTRAGSWNLPEGAEALEIEGEIREYSPEDALEVAKGDTTKALDIQRKALLIARLPGQYTTTDPEAARRIEIQP